MTLWRYALRRLLQGIVTVWFIATATFLAMHAVPGDPLMSDKAVTPEIRANLPKVSDWPTFPQLFVDGELVGGCDIMTEMFEAGELKQLLDDSAAKRASA